MFGSIGYFWKTIRSELSPLEDRSSISINMRAQEGATFEFIRDYSDRIAELADSIAPERKFLTNRASSSNANISVILPDIKERERSQMEIAEKLSAAVRKETQARAFVQQQSTLRRTPRRYAGTVCTTSSQPGKTGGTPADLHAKGQRKPYIPDGGREPEIHQAGNAHRDRPRQGFFAGRQYPQHSPDIAVCTERAAHGGISI